VRLSPNATIFGTLLAGGEVEDDAGLGESVGGFEGAPLHPLNENAISNKR
jgi:hypothetical protein